MMIYILLELLVASFISNLVCLGHPWDGHMWVHSSVEGKKYVKIWYIQQPLIATYNKPAISETDNKTNSPTFTKSTL